MWKKTTLHLKKKGVVGGFFGCMSYLFKEKVIIGA
jgi:hypothetical protein